MECYVDDDMLTKGASGQPANGFSDEFDTCHED